MRTAGARRWWALIAVAASMLVVGLDLTVLNLALPTIANTLHAPTSDLQWFNDAYSLVLAAAVLPAGLLGDRYGRKKVLMISLAVFGVSSAACAYAASPGELIAARAVLGLGAAGIMPLALAIIPVLFGPEERQKATAILTFRELHEPDYFLGGGFTVQKFHALPPISVGALGISERIFPQTKRYSPAIKSTAFCTFRCGKSHGLPKASLNSD